MNRVTRVLTDIYWGFCKITRVVNRVPIRDIGAGNRDAEGGKGEAQGSKRGAAGAKRKGVSGKRGGLNHGSTRYHG